MVKKEALQLLEVQLEALGLRGHEPAVYATLMAASPANATYLAKKCTLSRSSVYTTLGALIARGLVGTTYKNDVKQFVAQDADALERLLIHEKEAVEKKLMLMNALRGTFDLLGNSAMQIPQILFFEGQEGLKKIYLSMMRQAPKNSTRYLMRDEFVWRPEWEFIFKQDWSDTIRHWASEKNMRTRLLVNSSKTERNRAKFYKSQKATELRFLPAENAISHFALYIIGDTIAVLSMEKNNFIGIQISNRHLADNFKNTFSALWKGSSTKG